MTQGNSLFFVWHPKAYMSLNSSLCLTLALLSSEHSMNRKMEKEQTYLQELGATLEVSLIGYSYFSCERRG